MEADVKADHFQDYGNLDKKQLSYRKLKGFLHIWDSYRTEKGAFVCSYYKKEKGKRIASIRNSSEGWVIHLFIGVAKFKSYFKTVNNLEDAEEYCNLFLDNKLILESWGNC